MKRSFLYYTTPCILVSVFCFCMMMVFGLELVTSKQDGKDWVTMFLIVFIPVVTVLLGVDYFIKKITNDRLLYIWLIEAALIALLIYLLSGFLGGRMLGC